MCSEETQLIYRNGPSLRAPHRAGSGQNRRGQLEQYLQANIQDSQRYFAAEFAP